MPMEKYTHKLIQPVQQVGYLHELILCWNKSGVPEPLPHVKYSTNVNIVNCPDCIACWREGIYR